jgi:hypothetical protein
MARDFSAEVQVQLWVLQNPERQKSANMAMLRIEIKRYARGKGGGAIAPLSIPKRGPKCKLGYHRVFNLILWVLYTGMQWKCLPIPKDAHGKPAIHYTNIYKAFAKWADDGSLEQAFMASVVHLAAEKPLDLRVLHGDGTNTVAKKGAMGLAIPAISTRRARR